MTYWRTPRANEILDLQTKHYMKVPAPPRRWWEFWLARGPKHYIMNAETGYLGRDLPPRETIRARLWRLFFSGVF